MKRASIFKTIFCAKIKPAGTLKPAQDKPKGKKSQPGFQLGSRATPFPRMTVVLHTSSGKEKCFLVWWQPNRVFKGLSGVCAWNSACTFTTKCNALLLIICPDADSIFLLGWVLRVLFLCHLIATGQKKQHSAMYHSPWRSLHLLMAAAGHAWWPATHLPSCLPNGRNRKLFGAAGRWNNWFYG